jgi:hypothetical protein
MGSANWAADMALEHDQDERGGWDGGLEVVPDPAPMPVPLDYIHAIAHAQEMFTHPLLQQAVPLVHDPFGNPAPLCGQNAAVFLVKVGDEPYAVRCFLREQPGLRERYEILTTLEWRPSCLVGTTWIDDALEVGDHLWPVVVMELVEGIALDEAVDCVLDDKASLRELADRFEWAIKELRMAGISHGDLQHANVLVQPDGALRLIDYDGIHVDGLWEAPAEVGHPCYRHPRRTSDDWGASMDTFSALVIWTSLRAVCVDPALWAEFHRDGENLLFDDDAFSQPHRHPIWRALYESPDPCVARAAERLAKLCYRSRPPELHAVEALAIPSWEDGRPLWPEPLPALPRRETVSEPVPPPVQHQWAG